MASGPIGIKIASARRSSSRGSAAACAGGAARVAAMCPPSFGVWKLAVGEHRLHAQPGWPAHFQKSVVACGSAVALQNSVILPSRRWLTLATGISIDLFAREADRVHRTTACSSLASTS
jgi:hypothetical protein